MAFPEIDRLDPWRDRALARSLGPARARSVDRLERLVDAARALANETGSAAFTVAQVASRAGVNLKGFYRYFASKDDLLVALLEEDSRLGSDLVRAQVDEHSDSQARLRAAVTGALELITWPGALGYAGVLIREHRRLAESRPEELHGALAPLIDVLADAVQGAVDAGVAVAADPRRVARTMFALVLEAIHDVVLGRAEPLAEAEFVWAFCWHGVHRERVAPSLTEEDR